MRVKLELYLKISAVTLLCEIKLFREPRAQKVKLFLTMLCRTTQTSFCSLVSF